MPSLYPTALAGDDDDDNSFSGKGALHAVKGFARKVDCHPYEAGHICFVFCLCLFLS